MPNLTNSTTSILKATYVPLTVSSVLPTNSRAVVKSGYVRQLKLQSGEVSAVQKALADAGTTTLSEGAGDANFWSLLQQFEGTPLASQLPPASSFGNVTDGDLSAFGNALVTIRQQAVQSLQQAKATAPSATTVSVAPAAEPLSVGSAMDLLNTSIVAGNAFSANLNAMPIGMLNLERLEMTPTGIERGGLLATIPLAPRERTAVVQQEWSVTTQEFTSIVTDSLENYSQTGVTENTQLTQSTTSQVSHANQFNVTASASGGIGFVTGSVTSQFGAQNQNSQSATASRNHSIQTTRQASTRVKQSHKMTISTTTVTGSSESTTRMLENPSATDPMRIDYFSLMRKWYVALYRYGLRLTYDITVPEPGAAMREIFMQLSQLQAQASQGFVFNVSYADITPASYLSLASANLAQVSPPPANPGSPMILTAQPTTGSGWYFYDLAFTVPDGYWITDVTVVLNVGQINSGKHVDFEVIGSGWSPVDKSAGEYTQDLTSLPSKYMLNYTGAQTISFFFDDVNNNTCHITATITIAPTPQAMEQWVAGVWSALYNAAQQNYYTQQQVISAQIGTLQNQINSVDTLTLRREEGDEIMKCVLRWLLGQNFEFMPQDVINLFTAAGGNLQYGINFTGNDLGPSSLDWNLIYQNESTINFINQAIEWENVTYFLYSYFWDVPPSWDFIRQIQHPDSTRQAFLRAGAARVVLTVRQGWEVAWTYFVETGLTTLPNPLPAHPYLTIAQQIAAYDSTNYPGIPPANPDGGGPVDDDTPQVGTTCDTDLVASPSSPVPPIPVTIPVADSSGFVVGATAIIDNWDAGIDPTTGIGPGGLGIGAQETQTITAVTPSPPSITVQQLQYAHSAAGGPFPIVQAGAKGVLIGEWFEYTPTSGTDIAVTSNLGTIA